MSDPGVMLGVMPRTARFEGLDELLEKQFAVVSRAQLLGLGMNDHAVQYRVRAGGPWRGLLPGVYLGVTGEPNLIQKEMAALLYAGTGSVITGPTALLHYSIRSESDPDTIDVLMPAARQRHDTGFVRLHRTTRLPERFSSLGPLRFALVPRAVADTARQLTGLKDVRDVRAVVADAVQQRRCTVSQLAAELVGLGDERVAVVQRRVEQRHRQPGRLDQPAEVAFGGGSDAVRRCSARCWLRWPTASDPPPKATSAG
jgi:hypothetical protein